MPWGLRLAVGELAILVRNGTEEQLEVAQFGRLSADAVRADVLGGIKLQGSGRAGENDDGNGVEGRLLLPDPFNELEP